MTGKAGLFVANGCPERFVLNPPAPPPPAWSAPPPPPPATTRYSHAVGSEPTAVT